MVDEYREAYISNVIVVKGQAKQLYANHLRLLYYCLIKYVSV